MYSKFSTWVLVGSFAMVVGAAQAADESVDASVCPWAGFEADRFDGPVDPGAPGFGSPVIATGTRTSAAEVAGLLRQASGCGWTAHLATLDAAGEGVIFRIELARGG